MAILPNTAPALEAAYVARLKKKLPELEVLPHPSRVEDYRLLHPVGAVLVGYRGGPYGEPRGMGPYVAQNRILSFEIVAVAHSLRTEDGHTGAMEILEAARMALVGYEAPGFRHTYAVRDRFLDYNEGEWKYGLTVAASTTAVQVSEEVAGTILQHVTIVQNDEPVEVPSA